MSSVNVTPPPGDDRGFFVPVPLTSTPPEDVYEAEPLMFTVSVTANITADAPSCESWLAR